MTSLPTLRRKILHSFSLVVALYAALGILLMASVKIITSRKLRFDCIGIQNEYRLERASISWL